MDLAFDKKAEAGMIETDPRRADIPSPRTPPGPRRRGIAVVAVVVLLLIVGLLIIGMVHGGARDQALTARRVETVQAFYAAEAGINMAVRELMLGQDEDGDGGIGTISDDATDGNDPTIGSGQCVVTAAGSTTITSVGRSGLAKRSMAAALQD